MFLQAPNAESLDTIETVVSVALRMPIERLHVKRRRAEIVKARQIIYYLGHKAGLSYPFLAERYEHNHTTVMYAVEKIERLRKEDPDLDKTLTELSETVEITMEARIAARQRIAMRGVA